MEKQIDIRYINTHEKGKEWNEIISSSNQSTFFHTSYWLNIIEIVFKLKPNHLILLEKEGLILAIPLFVSKNSLYSPYTADYGGTCIGQDYMNNVPMLKEAFKNLFHAIGKISKKERSQTTYIRGHYTNKAQEDHLNEAGFKRIAGHLTYVLSDFYNVEDTLSIFHKKTRNAVRKALKEDIMVEHISSDSKDMVDYYNLHTMTKKKHGSDPYPKRFFDLLPTIPSENIEISIAKHNGICIAGVMGFVHNSKVHVFDNCSDPEYLKMNPNNLLYYTLIEKAKVDKMEIDFGRTSPEDRNLRQFKERWGGKMHAFGTYRKIMPPVIINTFKLAFGSVRERGFRGTLNRARQRG